MDIKNILKKYVWLAVIVALVVFIPVAFFVAEKFLAPAQTWYNNSWQYRKPITVSYTGSTKTNYDIELTVDTAALVTAGKIQSDCDDIRFVDSDDTTVINYWIEGGCNTSNTTIWVRVPSVPNGGKTIYMYYGNGSATSGQQTWSGTIQFYSDSSCPVGSSQNNGPVGRFLYGGTTYGVTGGGSSHSHTTTTCSNSPSSGGVVSVLASGSTNVGNGSHTHNTLSSGTISTASSISPPYKDVRLCSTTNTRPFSVSGNAVNAAFKSSLPTGWTSSLSLNGLFPSVANTPGGTGGATTHSHTYPANLVTAAASSSFTSTVSTVNSGDGADGSISISGVSNLSTDAIVGGRTCAEGISYNVTALTSTTATLNATPAAGCLVAGDEIMLISLKGSTTVVTNVGNLEFLTIQSISTNVITFTTSKTQFYGDGASDDTNLGVAVTNQRVALYRVPNYVNVTITSSGSLTADGWVSPKGGVLVFKANGTVTIDGSITMNAKSYGGGAAGTANVASPASIGFQGGNKLTTAQSTAQTNGGGGGGSSAVFSGAVTGGGGGGGYATAGIAGGTGTGGTGGAAGATFGGLSETAAFLGAGGGGGGSYSNSATAPGAAGGAGGGIIYVQARTFTMSGSGFIQARGFGGSGGSATRSSGGGGGSGGSIFIAAHSVTLGNNVINALGGSGGPGGGSSACTTTNGCSGGNGGDGRIRIRYGTLSGTTTPSASSTQITASASSHTHTTITGSTTTGSNIPPYLDMVFGSAGGTVVNLPYSSNAVVMFSALPPLGWTRYAALDDKFIEGANAFGGSGGSATHTHDLTLTTGGPTALGFFSAPGTNASDSAHTHSCTVTSPSASNLPNYFSVIYGTRVDNVTDGVSPSFGVEASNVPLAPSSTGATALTTNSIRWNFIDNSNNETGFKVYTDTGVQQVDCPGADLSSCDESGLSPNTSYTRKFLAYNAQGNSDFSNAVSRYTLMPVPTLGVGTITINSVALSVSGLSNLTEGTSGAYFDCSDTSCDTGLNSWIQTTSATATGLSANTTYHFQVKARNAESAETAYSSASTVTTLANAPTISSGSITSSTIALSAGNTANLTNGTSGVYFDCTDSSCNTGLNAWTQTASATATGLSPNVQYHFQVKARNAVSTETAYSTSTAVYSGAATPSTPTGVDLQSTSSVNVKVSVNSNPASTQFAIHETTTDKYVSSVDGSLQVSADWKTYTQWGGATGIDVTGLTAGTQYTFEVKARNGDNVATAFSSTLNLSTLLSTPTLTLGTISSSSITWTISAVTGATSYKLYDNSGSLLQTCPSTSCLESGLSANVQYSRKVKAFNAVSNSDFSNTLTKYTKSAAATINSVTTDTDSAIIDWTSNNPASTEFNVQETVTGKYLNPATGHFSDTILWGTYTDFSNVSSELLGLSPYDHVTFVITGRNGDGTVGAASNSVSIYVKATVPNNITLNSVTDTTANVSVNVGSDPSAARYLVYIVELDKYYNFNDGTLSSSPTGLFTTAANLTNITLPGLSSNTAYTVKVKARNQDNVETSFSSGTTVTTNATRPGKVVSSVVSSSIITIKVNPSTNDASTLFAVKSNVTGLYVNHSTGVVQASPDFATYADWGGASGIAVIDLSPDHHYQFVAIAKNSIDVQTAQSATYDDVYTLANTPAVPSVSQYSSTSVLVVINTNGNPSGTEYAIYVEELGKYVNDDDGHADSATPFWQPTAGWNAITLNGLVVGGLHNDTTYTFKVKARNTDHVETSYSSNIVSTTLNAPTIGTPIFNADPTNGGYLSSEIRWQFTDNESQEIGYRVFDTNGVQTAECASTNISSCNETGLSPNTSYTRKVAAYNAYGRGNFSATATTVTPSARPVITSVTAVSPTSIRVILSQNGNPSGTLYELANFVTEDDVDPATGQFTSLPALGTYNEFGGASGIVVTGLNPDTLYRFMASSRNSDGLQSAFTSNSNTKTLANVPGKVATQTPGGRSADTQHTLEIVLNNSSNPTTTEYAVRSRVNGLYVNHSTLLFQADPDWATYANWGSSVGKTVGSLDPNNKYEFVASARNGLGVITDESSTFDSLYTYANVPGVPTVSQVTSTSVRVIVDSNGNPTNTKFVIYFEELNKYVNHTTLTLQSSPDWATYSQWNSGTGVVVTGLTNGSSHTVKVKARNQDLVESDYNSSNIAVSLEAPIVTGGATVIDSTTIRWNFTETENDEIGVRVYDFDGVQTAQCIGTNLTFCDETGLTPNTSVNRKLALYNVNGHGTFSSGVNAVTFASQPTMVSATAFSSSAIQLKINNNSNSSGTEFAIQESTSGYYLNPETHQLQPDEFWSVYDNFGGADGNALVSSLFSNANYTFKVKARNDNGAETGFSSEVSKYTLARQPGLVTTVVNSPTSMRVVITSLNNASTLLAIRSNVNGLYLNHSTGILQGSPDFAPVADFGGGTTGMNVINLDPNNRYQFVAIAKNGDGVLTAQSGSFSSVYTSANTPSEPTITRISSTSLKVGINTNGNPTNTQYAIYVDELGKYLNVSDGRATADSAEWQTKSDWDGVSVNGLVVTSLTPGSYTFKIQAENQDGEETPFNLVNILLQFDAPTISAAELVNSSTIKWNFTDNTDGETGYRVFDTNGVQVSQCTGVDLSSCNEYGLSPNASYTRKIAAFSNAGNGLFSSTATMVTPATNPIMLPITTDSSTALTLKINKLSNPTGTQFEIQESISGYYVNPTNGQLQSAEVWGTYSDFGGANGIRVTGLFSNAIYTFKVRARNSDNVNTTFSSEVSKYTKAVAPGTPLITSDGPTGVVMTLNNGGNSFNTEFAVKEVLSNKYADNLSSALGTSPRWVKMSDLTAASLRLSGLNANTRYSFLIMSRNADNDTTDSPTAVSVYTLANTPNPLTLSQVDSKDVKLKVGDVRNPANTQYSVMDKSTNNFLNISTGQLQSSEVWGTSNELGSTDGLLVKSLTPGKKYELVIKARNGDLIPTSYSTSNIVYTQSAISNIGSSNAVTTKSLNLKISKQGNDDSVQYSVYEDSLNKYVDINTGFLVDNPSWGTYSAWGGDSGFVVVGLASATDYSFKVNSKNAIDQESGLGAKINTGTNAIITNLPGSLTVGLATNFNVNPATVAGSQRGLQRILAQENNFRVADIPILFSTDRDWSNITIDSSPDESKTVVKVHEAEGFTGKYIMYVVKNDSTRFILCTKAENLTDVNINCDGSIVFVGPYPQTLDVNGNNVKVSITILDGVQYWMVEGLSGTGGLGVKVEDDGTITEPSGSGDGGTDGSTDNGGTGGDNTDNGGSDTSGSGGNVVQQTTTNVTKTVNNVVKAVQNVPKQTTQAIQGINTALDNTVGTLPQDQLTVVTTTASVATVTVGLASLGGGLSSLPYYILELVFGVLSFLGFRKTGKPYGFVYDAVTKEPISRAVVRVYNSRDKLMWTDVTDVFGTFNAKLDKGKYKILVQKSGYKFPTQIIAGLSDYPLEPIYHGELVGLDSSKLFNVMIPVDPSGVNKFLKFSIKTKNIIEATVKYLNIVIFLAGLTLALYMYNKYPNPLNLLFVCVYIPTTILILKNILVAKKEWGKVSDRKGKAISGVEVVLKDMEYGRYVGKRITEADGLYRFVVSKGSYELLVVSDDYKVVKYEGGSNVVQIAKNDNVVIAKNIIVAKKAKK